ncbi:MAG: PDZ domain-containing protein [Planctomycetota bacterium]
MNSFEKIVWVIVGLGVLAVVALVGLHAAGISLTRSGITNERVKADQDEINAHLDPNWRDTGFFSAVDTPEARAKRAAAAASAKGGPPAQGIPAGAGRVIKDGKAERVTSRDPGAPAQVRGPIPSRIATGGAPTQSGGGQVQLAPSLLGDQVPESPPIMIPASFADKYRHLPDAREGLNSAESWDIQYGGQTAIQLGQILPNSPLTQNLGLQPGDIVVAVNNQPVSNANGMAMYDQLKDEKVFRVEIDRSGSRFIMKYEVE